jgi:hypothetical protein
MKKPGHVNILGVEIPLATIAYATSGIPVFATLGEYHTYFSESDLEILKSIGTFEELESNRPQGLRPSSGVNRQIFMYDTLSKPAYDGSI